MSRRIAITGLGVFSPIGNGQDEFWRHLIAGTVGTGPIQAFDTSMFDAHNGGEVKHFEPARYFQVLNPETCGRTTQLAVAAAKMATEDADVLNAGYQLERIGICMGTTMGNQSIVEEENNRHIYAGPDLSAEHVSYYVETCITAAIAQELAVEGPCHVVPTACAAGNYAIGWGADMIRDGLVDVAIVGGADALSRGGFAVFHRLGAIADDVCQPFDRDRTGMLVSEGSGAIVLEDYDRALARGAKIYAELLSYGLACDAHHPTAPHPEGLGAQASMRRALKDAGQDTAAVSYISAHGTGTHANDASESAAVRSVFAEQADSLPVSSIKSMLGHTMGAASAIEAVVCALTIHHGVIPPTANYRTSDPACLQEVVPNQALERPVNVALSNSFAFGGNVSTIVMKRV
ncbi:beta-ketoacyl-[acyl-carrier-protein] synthase family protein [Dictyobacter formicarum]|uniref:3-oxoacyl-ACP synthase n=1 Tax=Dictyobacter formicarum TaxID=2778368 RepID=A0ABQ3VWU7_9CHLR|nr:beta-ketoacyl-[acyl-carrier-protein] synthase family protein [Dictyobacter formicarum]GHO89521.1 3-oxoacyl-ACP synthase [Dictyobacter formicarum]